MATKRIEQLVKSVNSRLQPVMEFDRFYAALYDPIRSLIEFPWVAQDGQPVEWNTRPYQATPWLLDSIIQTKASRLVEQDFEQTLTKDGLKYWPEGDLPKSWLAAPMMIGDRVIGVLVAENWRRPNAFGENNLRIFSSAARQAAQAIENARLYSNLEEIVQERTEQLQKRNEQLAALQEIGIEITALVELDKALGSIVEHANELLSADFSTLFPYDAELRKLGKGIRKGKVAIEPSIPSSTGYSSRIAQDQYTVFIEDAEHEPGVKPIFIENKKVKSFAGVPLLSRGRTVGILYVNYLERHGFSQEEQTVIGLLANQAAVALENARLYRQLEERLNTTETERIALQQLLSVNDLAGQFVHRIANLVGAIKPYIDYVQDAILLEPPDRANATSDLSTIKTQVENILTMSKRVWESTKKFKDLGNSPLWQRVDANDLLDKALELAQRPERKYAWNERVQTVKKYTRGALLIDTFEALFMEALVNLICNAVDAISDTGGTLTLKTSRDKINGSDYAVLEIKDTGKGIPKKDQDSIFNLMFSTKPGGVGYGLFMVKRVCVATHTEINLESTEGAGTVFRLTIPLAQE